MLEDEEGLREHDSLVAALNLDRDAADESWHNFVEVKRHYTLEGDPKHWLGCAIYVACRRVRVYTVGRPSVPIEGNLVSHSSLLRHSNLTVLEFFKKCKKWVEWSEMQPILRARLDHLERKFTVTMVVFLKYRPIFVDMFLEPIQVQTPHKSKKPRTSGCTSIKLFDFTWTLFLCLKSRVPDIAEDLVNSFHLLLATCDLVFGNAVLDDRRDLLNPSFAGLPPDFHHDDYKPAENPPCIIDLLSRRHGAISAEAAFAKTYCLRPQVSALLHDGVLKGVKHSPETILLPQLFETNMRGLDNSYAEYVISVGDVDERIFLSEEASNSIGANTRAPDPRDHVVRHIRRDPCTINVNMTPLSGRELLKDKESPSKAQSPLSSVTQSVRLMISLISGRPVGKPSEALLQKFRSCSPQLEVEIAERVRNMGEKFMEATTVGQVPGHDTSAFFCRRLEYASTLYFRVLENVLDKEQTPDLKGLLERDVIHQSIFACCLEIVMFSYGAQRPFPWVLDALEIEPYYFYRVIEIIVRSEETFSRAIIKHLTMIEERVLESLVWRSGSPLWEQIRSCDQVIPRCDEVSLPSQLLNETEMNRADQQQPLARPQLADRYTSPVSRQVRPGQSLLNTKNATSDNSSVRKNPHEGGVAKKPTRTGSLALFFRKFYFLANVRIQDLCMRLDIIDMALKRKIWTCFEYSLINSTEIMCDRHVDQILMCAVYVMCRVLHTSEQPTNTNFTDILKVYKNQPQAESSVYRNVLLSQSSEERRMSTDETANDEQPPVEKRGNLIQFYNNVYMQKIEDHAREYAVTNMEKALPLSPLPRIRTTNASTTRKLTGRIYMNPMDVCLAVGSFDDIDGSAISIHDSPAKDLDAINEKVLSMHTQNKPVKRLLGDSLDLGPNKQCRTLYMKINNVWKDRSKQ